jgi:multidrug efflux pump subunit AcrA (membrane-fusion protein)
MAVMSVDHLPGDNASLKRQLLAREAELAMAQAELTTVKAEAARALSLVASAEATIAHYKLLIEKLRRAQYGQRSERGAHLLDQLELQLEEAEATASEAAYTAAAGATTVRSFARRKQSRKPFPADLPRERVVVPGPTTCACCGSDPAGQDRRGCHRDAGGRAAAVEGSRDGAREVQLPSL